MMVLNGSRQTDALDGGQGNDDCHGGSATDTATAGEVITDIPKPAGGSAASPFEGHVDGTEEEPLSSGTTRTFRRRLRGRAARLRRRLATSIKVEQRHPGMPQGQAAAWKRTRARSATAATRSGPSTAGSWRSMLGRRRAATTGTPFTTTLPQGI
jgi:hypothetical protein